MFGWGAKKPEDKPADEANNNTMEAPAKTTPSKEKLGSFQSFDPTGLERAVEAMKELNKSPNVEQAISLQKETEKTKQTEFQAKMEEDKARAKAFEVQRARVQEEERRKTLQQEQQAQQQTSYYNDQLARKRQQDQMNAQRAMKEHEMRRQEETAMKIEQLKRQTAEYEAQLKKEVESVRVQQEVAGRIRQERENWDLHIEQKKMEAQAFRETVLLAVKEAAVMTGNGIKEFMTDYEKMGTTIAGLSLLAVGVYTAKNGTGVAARAIEARIGKPPLVRETSRRTVTDLVRNPIKSVSSLFAGKQNSMKGVVIDPDVHKRLDSLAVATYNTKKNGAPYRHMLLHGPPGTGKTMWAKNLAQASGMDYAILTGGDVAPLGREGVTEIHKLFDWAATSRKGLLLFVDESDAFLRKRSNEHMSEDLRNALNAFLYRTGESSKNFMIVFASNQPEQLDWAVNDRTDEMVYFGLPALPERVAMIKQYFDLMIKNPPKGGLLRSAQTIKFEGITDESLEAIAARVEGFSGREISKLGIAWQSAAYGSADCTLTPELLNEVVDARVEQHVQKHKWEGEEGQRAEIHHVGKN